MTSEPLCKMLNDGMDPNAELPFPVPREFHRRFSDGLIRYYVSNEEGFTALMLATALGNHTFVKILLLAGADPWKLTKKHKTFALWLAAKNKNIEIMRSLMGIGPDHASQAFRITIDLSTQRASLWRNGKVVLATRISSGTTSHPTPRGRYLVTNKYRQWKSTCTRPECRSFCDCPAATSDCTWGRCRDIPPRTDASACPSSRHGGSTPRSQSALWLRSGRNSRAEGFAVASVSSPPGLPYGRPLGLRIRRWGHRRYRAI